MWFCLTFLILVHKLDISSAAGEIAIKKCVEYAEHVYSMEDSPVLSRRSKQNRVSNCGMVEVPLVIGGEKTKPKEFPHMAVIGYGSSPHDPKIEWKCGGTLISDIYVLTAAHCINDGVAKAVKVRFGEVDFMSDDESQIQERNIEEKINHPDYKPELRYNDIALIKLDSPVEFNAHVRPACLHTTDKVPSGLIATGFGKTAYENSEGSKHLMKVNLNVIPANDCTKYFKNEIESGALSQGLTETIICAGHLTGGKDTCQGDSGGPLQMALAKPYCMYSIAGVVSFGKFCGFANMPAIYTTVSKYIPWIESIVWN